MRFSLLTVVGIAGFMPHLFDHAALVEDWVKQREAGLSSERLRMLFDHGLNAVVRRANQTLGEITLTAIVDRVLYEGKKSYPWLDRVEVKTLGVSLKGINVNALPKDELRFGLRLFLISLINLLGYLTAETLTPPLYDELQKVGTPTTKMAAGPQSHAAPSSKPTVKRRKKMKNG